MKKRISEAIILLIMVWSCTNRIPLEENAELIKKALPVWAQGRETEMNLTLGFKGIITAESVSNPILKITASTLYRVYINGEFLGYGPARASHGYYRIDEYALAPHLHPGINVIAIEVTGYNVNSYYVLDQPSFLQAEVTDGSKVIIATGKNHGFEAMELKGRVKKVERYSFQRPFIEYYRLEEDFNDWRVSDEKIEGIELTAYSKVKLLPRNLELPSFILSRPKKVINSGNFELKKPKTYYKDRSLTKIGTHLKGYPEDQLEVIPSLKLQEIITRNIYKVGTKNVNEFLKENEFYTLDFGTNLTGFIGAGIVCTEPTLIYFVFDEILLDGDVNQKKRMRDINNIVGFELAPGTYQLESFEPYTFKYLKLLVMEGNCKIDDIYLRQYVCPENKNASFTSDDPDLNQIFSASKQTFKQNSVDLFMDCPSRERAGWLCDSRFIAIMEKELTGNDDIAFNFYQNYALPTQFDSLPKGMIPMCYPADHYNGDFIPNYALWFIVQIKEYMDRDGDPELVKMLEPRIMGILDYFTSFENEDGLLEDLEGWKFVGWSKANKFTNGVNYPTNVLYAQALFDAAILYKHIHLKEKSQKIRKVILNQSFNGDFFVDNAIRDENNNLKITSNISEDGQYYAFFFNVVTPETHPDLWKKLIVEFGPGRDDQQIYPGVSKANAFLGNYMRMEILSRYGFSQQVLNEMKGDFLNMAKMTGTLWEHMASYASCNHGFASFLGHLLYQNALGIINIDYVNKRIKIRFTQNSLDSCEGKIPIGDKVVEMKWKVVDNQINYSIEKPIEYTVEIENRSGLKLVDISK